MPFERERRSPPRERTFGELFPWRNIRKAMMLVLLIVGIFMVKRSTGRLLARIGDIWGPPAPAPGRSQARAPAPASASASASATARAPALAPAPGAGEGASPRLLGPIHLHLVPDPPTGRASRDAGQPLPG